MEELIHRKIQIEYKWKKDGKNIGDVTDQEAWIVCYDCPSYSNFRDLMSFEGKAVGDVRDKIKKALEVHNDKINEKWNRVYFDVRDNSRIRYIVNHDLWEIIYTPVGSDEKIQECFGGLEPDKVKKLWKEITEKLVAKK